MGAQYIWGDEDVAFAMKLWVVPKSAKIAGRFMKGAEKGCIACHTATGGEDLETLTQK